MKDEKMMLMGMVAHLHKRVTATAFMRAGITRAQPWILDYLAEHDGCIQRELAQRHHFDPASITTALTAMEEQGLVRRESVPGDKRALRVHLTQAGRERQQFVRQVFAYTEAKALEGFSRQEEAQFSDFLLRIKANLEREGDKGDL